MSDLGDGRNGTVVAALLSVALNDAGRWVSIPASHLSVVVPARGAAGHWRVLGPLALSVPLNAYPDGQGAAVVAVLSSPGTHQKRQNVHSDQRASSRVYIRVRGIARPGLRVLTLTARHHAGQLPRSRGHVRVPNTVRTVRTVRRTVRRIVRKSASVRTRLSPREPRSARATGAVPLLSGPVPPPGVRSP